VTVPYLRRFKRLGGARVFAVFLQDPRFARASMDLIWVPEHDRHRGPNVIATLTSPHPFSARRLAAARAAPDARLAALPTPRCAVVLGGPSGAQHFTAGDLARMTQAVRAIVGQGFSIMATPSRRTPPELLAAVSDGLGGAPGFVWDGAGDNPYASILALADAVLVTGDSANMVGEATATGAPVHVFEPSGGDAGKLGQAIDALERLGAVKRFAGRIERFAYEPIDSSRVIAAEIAGRFARARAAAA
jgi:mitochondrial fission protein ELM1